MCQIPRPDLKVNGGKTPLQCLCKRALRHLPTAGDGNSRLGTEQQLPPKLSPALPHWPSFFLALLVLSAIRPSYPPASGAPNQPGVFAVRGISFPDPTSPHLPRVDHEPPRTNYPAQFVDNGKPRWSFLTAGHGMVGASHQNGPDIFPIANCERDESG